MEFFSLPRLTEGAIRHGLIAKTAEDCRTQAELLAFLAEFEARKLYVPDGYSTMFAYCLGVLHFSEDTAGRRLDVARTARAFPAIFVAVAEGRLHQSAVLLLADKLTAEDADQLIAAATHRSKSQIALMLAERFPQPDVPTRIVALPSRPAACAASPAPVRVTLESPTLGCVEAGHEVNPSPAPVRVMATAQVQTPPPRMKTTPLSPGRHKLEGTVDDGFVDLLGRAQDLHPGGALEVLRRGLEVLVSELEKRKFAATDKPRPAGRPKPGSRTIPADVRRQVRERDGDQCSFVSDNGQRCSARARLEFDHILEVARGGNSTVDNVRLLCRAHNQYLAERTYGAGFMDKKREEARRKAAEARAEKERARAAEAEQERAQAAAEAEARAQAAAERAQAASEVIPYLRALKFTAAEARLAAAHCEAIPHAPLEERVRLALRSTPLRGTHHSAPPAAQCQGPAA